MSVDSRLKPLRSHVKGKHLTLSSSPMLSHIPKNHPYFLAFPEPIFDFPSFQTSPEVSFEELVLRIS